MQTNFSLAQLADPDLAEANQILRNCVHCGFCTATCPTYVLLGDELDSPRGRIYLIKDMLENDKPASPKVVKHIDRCLSCLSCMTTCPSGVHYMHLVDQAREHIHKTFTRPLPERMLRKMLSIVLPRPGLFRVALLGAWVAKPFAPLAPGRLKAMLGLAPSSIPKVSHVDVPQTFPADGARKGRVAMLSGCAQQVLAPQINEATVRLLTRQGYDVVVSGGAGCCGALTHHMGDAKNSHGWAKANIDAWMAEHASEPLDAIIINASGCGTTVKDYGYMFRTDDAMADKAKTISDLTKDVTEFLADRGLDAPTNEAPKSLTVAYHSACSMQHGQKITQAPKQLLKAAGFTVVDPAEGHLCCGSAGTYNLMQPEIANQLKARKVANIEKTQADLVASGNIGCITQIGGGIDIPVVHTIELLDWATGGPVPKGVEG
jgi:glycolate oxidase iron-sulfur subunit